MPDYKSMYFKLTAKVADAVELLTEAQQDGENAYIESEHEPVMSIVESEIPLPSAESPFSKGNFNKV